MGLKDPTETRLKGICELVLESSEPERMVAFYERLGLPVLAREADRIWLEVDEGTRIGIWSPGEKEHRDRGGRHVHFALSVDVGTLDSLLIHLREAGAEVEGPITHDGGDRSIYLSDPEGNRVEIWDYFERYNDGDGPPAAAG
jgi:catechol-2,3-dioxygenase